MDALSSDKRFALEHPDYEPYMSYLRAAYSRCENTTLAPGEPVDLEVAYRHLVEDQCPGCKSYFDYLKQRCDHFASSDE